VSSVTGDGDGERRDRDGPGHEEPERGLARERTELAWTRSAIAFAALGAAILKVRPVVGVPVMAVGVVIWLAGHVAPRRDRTDLGSGRLLLVTIAVTSLALVSVVLTLAGPSSSGLRP
jgi:uncharacterized membrane protein YidH (DUF202 family)